MGHIATDCRGKGKGKAKGEDVGKRVHHGKRDGSKFGGYKAGAAGESHGGG